METRSIVTLVVFISIILQGCATGRRSSGSIENRNQSAPQASPEVSSQSSNSYGPPLPAIEPSIGPEPVEIHPIVLVLGPGLIRSYAYAGVIRALVDSKIPIAAIVTTETGSLIGTLYALSGNINQFEWDLQKLKGELFTKKTSFFSNVRQQPQDDERLTEILHLIFRDKNISDAKIPVYIGIPSRPLELKMHSEGSARELIRNSIVSFKPSAIHSKALTIQGKPEENRASSALAFSTLRSLAIEARSLNRGPVVVVDLLERDRHTIPGIFHEIEGADLVLRPDMNGIGMMDYQKKTESVFRGKNAVLKNIQILKHLVEHSDIDSSKRSAVQ